MVTPRLPLSATADGVVVTIRVTTRANPEGVAGMVEVPGPRGVEPALAVRVSAAPADGEANAAVLRVLARAWQVPPTSLSIVSGATSRIKRVLVRGDAPILLRQLTERIAA